MYVRRALQSEVIPKKWVRVAKCAATPVYDDAARDQIDHAHTDARINGDDGDSAFELTGAHTGGATKNAT